MGPLTIGRLAELTSTNIETIRFYEKTGVVPQAPRTTGNYRSYGQKDVDRLAFIKRTRALGFSLDEVRTLLDLSSDRERDCTDVNAIAARQLAEVDRKIADLAALRRELARAVATCAGGAVGDCSVIDAFQGNMAEPTGGN